MTDDSPAAQSLVAKAREELADVIQATLRPQPLSPSAAADQACSAPAGIGGSAPPSHRGAGRPLERRNSALKSLEA